MTRREKQQKKNSGPLSNNTMTRREKQQNKNSGPLSKAKKLEAKKELDGDSSSTSSSWLSKIAILGDSPIALGVSFVILLAAIGVTLWLDDKPVDLYTKLGPVPVIDPPHIYQATENRPFVTDEIRRAYQKDGVVAIRGLIGSDLLKALDKETSLLLVENRQKTKGRSKRQGTQFHMAIHNAIFREAPALVDSSDPEHYNTTAFQELILQSKVPMVAADLLWLEGNQTLRLMRDIFLTKDDDPFICGWHVDDLGFWPAIPDSPGINAWVALDDMPLFHGGGFALAVGSDSASWREEAHYVTGASTTWPSEGYKDAADMFSKRTGSGTCNLKTSAPHLHRRMEETKRIYPMQRGDVIFHTRWLFHRTVAFNQSYVAEHKGEDLVYRRYSIRYGPGSSVIPVGYGTEPSVLWNENNGGRTADQVSQLDGPWYPRAWPSVDPKELHDMADLVENRLPVAEERKAARVQEMKPHLKRLARQQKRQPPP